MNNEAVINSVPDTNVSLKIKRKIYLITKRTFDIMVGIVGIMFIIPIMIVVKISNMISGDFDKVIFSQKRIGKDGKEFKFYKFRSMIPNADEVLKKLLKENKEMAKEYRKNKKLDNDPRVTKIGKFLRKTSIDELPQLINVLKGDMSLIGNRPYLPREKEDMGLFYNDIVKTKPGLTGYWQVNGRSNTTFEERLRLERYYSEHASLKMDIKIFFKTFSVVLFRKGSK